MMLNASQTWCMSLGPAHQKKSIRAQCFEFFFFFFKEPEDIISQGNYPRVGYSCLKSY